jgi:hypothetical protein
MVKKIESNHGFSEAFFDEKTAYKEETTSVVSNHISKV